jgi:glycosyltransferase involved in cell wall biosynthesis
MKILVVHNLYRQPGGEDVVFQQERRMLQRAGHQVVGYVRSNSEIDAYPGIKRLALVPKTVWSVGAKDEFGRLLNQERPQIVHVHNTFLMISPAIYSACQEAHVPVVQTLHNYRLFCPGATFFRDGRICEECVQHSLWRSMRYGCYRQSHAATAVVALMLEVHRKLHTWTRNVNAFIVLTEFARGKCIEGGLPAEKLVVKPNFVSPDPGTRAGDGGYVLFAGRLNPEERVRVVLSAWEHLPVRIPLVIVGAGRERRKLQARTLCDDLSDISFRGYMDHGQTMATIKAARFLVFASEWYETFGLTIIEAFACGIPVLCSRRGAMQEIVEDGRTGLHFTPGDAEDLAQKVKWAWTHPERMREMGKEARREYEAKYTAERNLPLLMDIYERAIGSIAPSTSSS